jgi:ABC-type uncharacterized transport system substrate-binding protein
MPGKKIYWAAIACMCIIICSAVSQAAPFKVLVVMSYHEDFYWSQEIKAGIDGVLKETCDPIRYIYLDTRNHLERGEENAKAAYAVYQEFQPDGVIATDDNAQTLFVIPYLKDKVKTPVIFSGVNEEPETYGYPASNVTGVLEVVHFRESVMFLQQLVPTVRTVGWIMKDSPTAKGFLRQFKSEFETYPVKSLDFELPKTLEEASRIIESFKTRCDALFMGPMEGIRDAKGNMLSDKDAIPVLTKTFGKPTFCANESQVSMGVLCAIIKTAEEHGTIPAEMLLKAMNGTPISELPITRNKKGKAIVNVTVMKALGIKPKATALRGAELVETKE